MKEEKDDFWDIAALLPKRKNAAPPSASYGEVSPALVTLPSEDKSAPEEVETQKLHFADMAKDTASVRDYVPKENPFITSVRIHARTSHLHLFHGFKSEGVLWHSMRGEPAPYAPYFSFLPQHYQLNRAQKAYYLYFRDEANAGRYLEAGVSYVMLYIFEIINLPDLIPPKIGVLRLANVWAAYRKQFPALDKSMVVWLADYALLHGVACPRKILVPFMDEILARSAMKEFYLGIEEGENGSETDALILLTSAYKYQNSRYATGENKALFDTHIPAAAGIVLRHVFLDGGKLQYHTVTKRHDAYAGALWAGTERYELELTYYSLTGTDDLKILMTAAIKYAENKLRAYLSIKSRLSVVCLPDSYRILLDSYFDRALPVPLKEQNKRVERPDYEALYDPASVGVSLDEAENIEKSSWENTWRLIPEEEKEEIFAKREEPSFVTAQVADATGLTEQQKAFLSLLTEGRGADAHRYARDNALSYLTLGEEINEFFSDRIGDVVLLLVGENFEVIEDYETEIREVLASS